MWCKYTIRWYGMGIVKECSFGGFFGAFRHSLFQRKYAKMMLCVAKFKGDGMPISQLLLANMKQPCAKDL